MKLSVVGESESLSRREVRAAFTWAVRELLGTRIARTVDVRLVFEPLGRDVGVTAPFREERDRCSRSFVVSIDGEMKRRRTLRTLFHEAAHVRQYATGELLSGLLPNIWFKWKKRVVRGSYRDLPWEVEARVVENELELKYRAIDKSRRA